MNGVPLDRLDVPESAINIIHEFELYSSLSAYQISQKSSIVDSDTAAELRKASKWHRQQLKNAKGRYSQKSDVKIKQTQALLVRPKVRVSALGSRKNTKVEMKIKA